MATRQQPGCSVSFRTSKNSTKVRKSTGWAIVAAAAAASFGMVSRSHAQLYWDLNSTTAGANSGTTASGTWEGLTNWSTSSAGTATTGAWVSGSAAVFSAGTTASGTSSITVLQPETASAITFEDGTVNITTNAGNTFGAIVVPNTGLTVTNVALGKTNGFFVPVTGNGDLTFLNTSTGSGNAILNISAIPTFQGNLNIGAGSSLTNLTIVQLDYNLANSASVINMHNFSGLGDNNVTTPPGTGVAVPANYTVTNAIHLNVDNVAN